MSKTITIRDLYGRGGEEWSQIVIWLDENVGDDGMKSTKERNALIEEICPKCGNPEMYFYTMQLRSADEGSTVFYECPSCDHKFSANN